MDTYRRDIANADTVRSLNLEPEKWTVKQLTDILKPPKQDDEKLLKKRKELQSLYVLWSARMPIAPTTFDLPVNNNIEDENASKPDDNVEHDVVQAILALAEEEV